MTATVRLRVQMSLYEPDMRNGTQVFANLLPAEAQDVARRNLPIMAGFDVPYRDYVVEPGRYTVELLAPSGRVLTGDVHAREGEAVEYEFDLRDSPHESHSWQYLAGNVEPSDTYHRVVDPTTVGAEPVVSWLASPSDAATSWTALNTFATSPIPPPLEQLATDAAPLTLRSAFDPMTDLYHLDRLGAVGAPLPTGGEHPMLHVEFPGGDSFLVRLPVPWIVPSTGDEAHTEVLIDRRRNHLGSAINVTIRDPLLGSSLLYLAGGSLDLAAEIIQQATDLLFGKSINPLAAAAGGYVLVGARGPDPNAEWTPWIENLMNWFEWLPDGAILRAVVMLRTAADDPPQASREALLDAYGRGIPWYTVGLRWLAEGLAAFPDDAACRAALAHVRRLSWRADTRQPFVVVRTNGRTR